MASKTSALDMHKFRWAQDAQNRRAEQFSGGNKTEHDSYFGKDGEGDGRERKLNLTDWLKSHRSPEEVRAPHEQEFWRGHELGTRHGEDMDHADLKAFPRELERSSYPDHFFKGYSSGIENAVPLKDHQRIAIAVTNGGSPFRIYAHVSGNQIDILHCPFCGSGAVIGRSDGTVECGYCTTVFTVQTQPQYNGFPQSVNGQPYEWPGMPDPTGVAAPDMPEGTNLNPNTNGENAMDPSMDPAAMGGGAPDFQSSDPADGGDEEDEDGDGDDDKPAFLKGKGDSDKSDDKKKDKKSGNPFAKKKSYITADGAELDEANYLAHLAIRFADDPAKVARKVRESRRG